MFSRIQDLDRYKQDCIRFNLGIVGQEDDAIAFEGKRLFDELKEAVADFDNTTMGLIKKLENGVHLDHVAAQDRVQDTKIAMEHWMAKYSPNVHVDLLAETDK